MRVLPLPCLTLGICLLAGAHRDAMAQAASPETITIDARAAAKPFPHFWEQMFGSRRAVLSMRESYREDLRQVKKITDLQYVRFHAIFHDEVGVYTEDRQGNAVYDFDYVDQIYDGLLANGVKPFVELSYMPNAGRRANSGTGERRAGHEKKDGSLVFAVWNLAEPGVAPSAKSITLNFQGVKSNAAVSINRVDKTNGDVLAAYDKMGAPVYPSQEQLRQLREVERAEAPQVEHLHGGSFTLEVPAQGLAVVEVKR